MRYRLHRTLGILLALTIFTLPLSACGGGSDTPTSATTVPGATSAPTTGTGSGTTDTTPTTGGAATGETPTTATAMDETPTTGTAMDQTPATGGGTSTGAAFTSGGPIALPGNCANTQIAYWTPLSGPDGDAMTKLTDQFNSANSNVKVNITTGSFTDYITQLGTAAASNTLPDIAIINEDQVATQAFRNVLRPIPDNVMTMIGVTASD